MRTFALMWHPPICPLYVVRYQQLREFFSFSYISIFFGRIFNVSTNIVVSSNCVCNFKSSFTAQSTSLFATLPSAPAATGTTWTCFQTTQSFDFLFKILDFRDIFELFLFFFSWKRRSPCMAALTVEHFFSS